MVKKRVQPGTATAAAPTLARASVVGHPLFLKWGPPLSIVIFSLLFFWPSLTGVYIWDDNQWLTHNKTVQQTESFPLIWTDPAASPHYYPLVFTTFWVEYKLWGLGPIGADGVQRGIGYHVDNLLLHIGTSLLIFLILKKLKLPGGLAGAWLAAMVFAIHPVNVESVAWVAERKNVLCGVFFFSSMYYGLKFFRVIEPVEEGAGYPWKWKQYAAAIGLFVAALLSKTIASPLPAVFLLLIWWRRGRIRMREVWLTLPFFVLAIGFGLNSVHIEHGTVGTNGPDFAFSLGEKSLIASNTVWFYVGKLLWPYPVMQLYPRFPIFAGQAIAENYLYAAPVGIVVAVVLLFVFRRRISRGPLAAFLFFVGVLGPALGFITFYTMYYTFVTDHYQYLACIAIIVLVVESVLWILRRCTGTRPRFFGLAFSLLAGVLVVSLGALTYGFSSLYEDPLQLWSFNIEHSPESSGAYGMRGEILLSKDVRYRNAGIADIQRAIQLKPNNWANYEILAAKYLEWGDADKAKYYFDKADALENPGEVKHAAGPVTYPHGQDFEKAKAAEQGNNLAQAIVFYQADLQNYSKNAETLYRLGNCYLALNDPQNAAAAYRKAVALNDQFGEAWLNLAVALSQMNQDEEAVNAIDKARRIDPRLIVPLAKGSGKPLPK